jgi:hypothetical protein
MQQKNIALVTGSSSGIGFHTSLFFARAGFYTYATMRNLDKSSKIIDIAQEDNLPLVVIPISFYTYKVKFIFIDRVANTRNMRTGPTSHRVQRIADIHFLIHGAVQIFHISENITR